MADPPDEPQKKAALVTGATSGIGRAAAYRLARDGYRVAVVGRRRDRLEAMRAELGNSCLCVCLDLSVDGSAEAAVERALGEWGRLDVVVAAAGHGLGHGDLSEADRSLWGPAVSVNLLSAMALAGAACPSLVASQGVLVLIGSVFGADAAPSYSAYAAAKHGLRGFARSIRREPSLAGARVCLISPGTTNTEFASALRGDSDPYVHDPSVWGFEPLTPEDVAEAVSWVVGLPGHVDVEELTVRATRDR